MGLGNDQDMVVDDGDAEEEPGNAGDDGQGKSFGLVSCSICLEVVADNGDRSCAKLQCGHQFHLDCIGSAFNIKGAMQCPNCRKIEKGQWLYATGTRPFSEFSIDEWAHDDELYDLSYSEMAFGVHWCPFNSLARLPSSFEESEFSSNTYHDQLGQHAFYAENTALSSASPPCPYIYFGPIHPSSSNSNPSVSEAPSFNNHWNGPSVPSEVPAYGFPAVDLHYQNWDPYSSPFSSTNIHFGGSDHPSVPPVTQASSRASADMPSSGAFVHPFLAGHRAGSLVTSSMIPPYPGSNARARDRAQALQAYYQQQHPTNLPATRSPVVSTTRRPSNHRGMLQSGQVSTSSDQSGGFYFLPSGSSGHHFQEVENPISGRPPHSWDRDYLPPSFSLNQAERDSDPGIRSSTFRLRHGCEYWQ